MTLNEGAPQAVQLAASRTELGNSAGAPFMLGGGEAGRLLRDIDWSRHPLGLREDWPVILQTSLSLVLSSPQPMFVVWGPDFHALYNDAYAQICSHKHPVSLGQPMSEIWQDVWQQILPLFEQVYAGASIHMDDLELKLQRNGFVEDAHFWLSYTPLKDATGKVLGLFCICAETTEQVMLKRKLDREQAALQDSEQFLQSVLAASPDCIKVLDPNGTLTYITQGGRLVMEVPADTKVEGSFWPDFWEDAARDQAIEAVAKARTGLGSRFQSYANTFAGNRRYWDVRVTPMPNAQGTTERILAVSRDVTYLKKMEDEREHLMHELSHRLKNAFAMVQSLISQTFRQALTVQQGREILQGRVRALADAQDILTRSNTEQMDIAEVVEAALLPHRTGEGRFVISGPVAAINGRQGLGLSLALHELATNATKYGALTGPDGTVSIHWTVGANHTLSFFWRESGGPVVAVPNRRGFGSVLIERIVASYFDGSATLDFLPEGVSFQLTGIIAPLDAAPATDPY